MSKKISDSLQYLIDAVSGSAKINIPVLASGYFPKDNIRSAVYFMGTRSVVFAFHLQKQLKAIKIWPNITSESLRTHYEIVEKYINRQALGYFAGLSYFKEAINLDGVNYDALLMNWVGRQNIKEYVYANLDQEETLNILAEKVLLMHKALNNEGVSHGRLHTGNIYIDANNELKLIGYDSLFIQGEMEYKPAEQNHPDYRHPYLKQEGIKADYFAALVIYMGIKIIADDAVLWGRYKVGFHESFFFTIEDFLDIKNATIYKYIRKKKSPEINKLLDVLVIYCEEKDAANLRPFYTYLENDQISDSPLITVLQSQEVKKAETVINAASVAEQSKNNEPLITNIAEPAVIAHPNISVILPGQLRLALADKPVNQLFPAGFLVKENETIEIEPAWNELSVTESSSFISNENNSVSNPANGLGIKKQSLVQSKNNRKKILSAALILICLITLETVYFWNEFGSTNKANTPSVEPTYRQQPDETVKKTLFAQPAATDVQTNKQTTNSSAVKNQINDSLQNVQSATTRNTEKKTELNAATTDSLNTIAVIAIKNTSYRLPLKRTTDTKKQDISSFTIGTPPKEK